MRDAGTSRPPSRRTRARRHRAVPDAMPRDRGRAGRGAAALSRSRSASWSADGGCCRTITPRSTRSRRWSAAASTRSGSRTSATRARLREQEIGKLASEAELRALRAQINPHFLFNALTTIGYLIQTAPPRALATLMRLTALLRSVLRSEGEFTTLGRELELIESYLDIEHARFEQRLRVTHRRARGAAGASRAAAAAAAGGRERRQARHRPACDAAARSSVTARLELAGAAIARWCWWSTTAAPASTTPTLRAGRTAGVGLSNIERRLACQYGAAASADHSTASPGIGTTVEIRLPADYPRPHAELAAARPRRERSPARRHRRRRAAGAIVPRGAAALVRRCRHRRGGRHRARRRWPPSSGSGPISRCSICRCQRSTASAWCAC